MTVWALVIAVAEKVVQAVIATIAIDTDAPTAIRDIQGIIAIRVSVRVGVVENAIDGGVGVHAHSADRIAVELNVSGDEIRRQNGGEVRAVSLAVGKSDVELPLGINIIGRRPS